MRLKLRAHVSVTTSLLENLLFDSLKRTSHQLFTVTNLKNLSHLEYFRIPHQFFNRVFRVESIAAKYLQTKQK